MMVPGNCLSIPRTSGPDKGEKFLVTQSDSTSSTSLTRLFDAQGIDYKPAVFIKSVPQDLKDMDLKQKDQDFGTTCSLKSWVRLSQVEDFLKRLSGISGLIVEDIQ